MKRRGLIVLIALVVIIGVAYVFGKPYYDLHFTAISLEEDQKEVYIPSGSTLEEVAAIIATNEILSKDEFLGFAEQLSLTDQNLEPGKYRFENGMKCKNVIYALKNGNQEIKDVRITFNNCKDVYDMAGKVAPNIEADSASIVDYIRDPKTVEKYGFTNETIMTLFLPDTYEVGEWDFTAEEFVDRMADEYKSYWTEERKKKASDIGLSQSGVATLASIIQAEQSISSQEWETIAGLYINRLHRNIKLQSDPTAKYCWGDELEGVQRILYVHLEKDCPYNTYLYAGLPPGPIRMSSKKAMNAVLNYENHNYIFMCARPDNSGLHNFAETNAQHNRNVNKWRAYANSRGL